MKKLITLLLLFNILLYADFFNSAEKEAAKHDKERAHFCKIFTQKAINYEKNMRNDELAFLTLESYKKRAKIYCKKGEPLKIEQKVDKTLLNYSQNLEKKRDKKPAYLKKILLEDERLCKIYIDKLENYKKHMRSDELSRTTLESYKKRTNIFCSKETLEKKENKVLMEDKKLCAVFKQGPILCKKFDQNYTLVPNDPLAKETLQSFKKREEVFCSTKPLNKKDIEVYKEHNRLCELFSNKIVSYESKMRNDELAHKTLESYKKRAAYFCASKNPENKK